MPRKGNGYQSAVFGMPKKSRIDKRFLIKFRPDKFIAAFIKNKGLVYKTCEDIGIDPQTYYNHLHSNEQFKAAVIAANERCLDVAEEILWDKIEVDRDTASLLFYLKCKGKSRGYIEREQVDVQALLANLNDGLARFNTMQRIIEHEPQQLTNESATLSDSNDD